MLSEISPDLKLRPLWLAVGYAMIALVFFLSLTSNPIDTGIPFPYVDKFFHAFAYFSLMVWFAQIYHDKTKRNVIALVFIVMGSGLEFLQSFDPNRFAEIGDFVANTTGVVLGFVLTLKGMKRCLFKIEKLVL